MSNTSTMSQTSAETIQAKPSISPKIELDEDTVKKGLGRLVVTVIKLLHELLERQAIRRVEGGSLDPEQIEAIGRTLMLQAKEIERLREEFGLADDDLNLDLGPLGKVF